MAGGQSAEEGGGQGVHSPGGLHQQVPLSSPAGGGHHGGCKRQACIHTPGGRHRLHRMQQYNAARWAQQQQARVARQQSKRRRTQGTQTKPSPAKQPQKAKCPGKGGAKRSAGASASKFYAGPVLPPGARRGPQYCVTEEADIPAEPACSG